jgi:hypothetical protein
MATTRFLNEIVQFLILKKGKYSQKSRKNFDQKIRTLFLEYSSETEENLNAFHCLKYGKGTNRCGPLAIGFKVKKSDILISDILNVVEGIEEVPSEIKESFPNLTYAQWSAIMRITTVLLVELEDCRKRK